MKYIQFQILIIIVSISILNWMSIESKWKELADKYPVLKYKINPSLIGLNSLEEGNRILAIQKAARTFSFQNTESKLSFSYTGLTTEKGISLDQVKCDFDSLQALKKKEAVIYAESDSDCESQICSYVWSCTENPELVHFDMEINEKGYEFDIGSNHKKSYHLETVIAREFGRVAGLSYCLGKPKSECDAEAQLKGMSNPPFDSLLYKFNEAERIRTNLNVDDKMGLDAIYGTATEEEKKMRVDLNSFFSRADTYCVTPCVVPELESNPKYRYNEEEKVAIRLYFEEIKSKGYDKSEFFKEKYTWIQNYYFLSFSSNKYPAERYLLEAIEKFNYFFLTVPLKEFFELERILISVQIESKNKMLEEAKWELDPQFYEFTESELKILISLRRKYIDSL